MLGWAYLEDHDDPVESTDDDQSLPLVQQLERDTTRKVSFKTRRARQLVKHFVMRWHRWGLLDNVCQHGFSELTIKGRSLIHYTKHMLNRFRRFFF